ncbi:MAG: hypothetical protein ACRBBS_03035 [Thalassovita sp.]
MLMLILSFRHDIKQLIVRTKSLEIAGTKSEFSDHAAVFGYLEKKAQEVANESDPAARKALAKEIKATTTELGGIHPLSLGFLIEIGRGVGRDDSWAQYSEELFSLSELSLIEFRNKITKASDITRETEARLTVDGLDFLKRIGFPNAMWIEHWH